MQLAIAAELAILAVVAIIVIANGLSAAPPPIAAGIRVSGNVIGEPNAPVTIEEWADLQCPACRAFALGTEPQLRTAYIATGKVRLVFHQAKGVTATPTFFITGQKYEGVLSSDQLRAIIDPLIK